MSCKPGIRPSTIVADSNGRVTVDYGDRLNHASTPLYP
jgi:hypothetical protein